MVRLAVIVALVAVTVAAVAVSALLVARTAGQALEGADMEGNLGKLAYVLLFAISLGVSVGWLGGL